MQSRYLSQSDEALAHLAQNGDVEAEEVLIRRYTGAVRSRSHLYFIAGADSEDVIQEGMIGLVKAIKNYSEEKDASFGTFAYLCITRQILNAIKLAARKKNSPLNESVSLNDDMNSIGEIVDADAVNPEQLMILNDMTQVLMEDSSEILSSFEHRVLSSYLEGKKYSAIAEENGKSVKSIDNAMQRIRKKIAAYILSD